MIYLDNSATTKLHPEVLETMLPYLKEEYGNPSSKFYLLAENAKKAVKIAREQVALLLGCDDDEIVFTSGATESNNMIIKGVQDYYGRISENSNYMITSQAEHPSVLESFRYLEERGTNVKYLEVDSFARVNVNELTEELKHQPLLTSIIWGNNEIGSLNPIPDLAQRLEKNNLFFHTDATQIIGKVPFNLKDLPGIRFLSMSGHKIGGPKGIGVAVIRKQSKEIYTKLTPLLHGGGQENDYRSGTLAVHNIVGLGKAAEIAHKHLNENITKLKELEKYLIALLSESLGNKITFNSDTENKIPGLISLQFIGVNNELLLKKLSPFLALSSGSACSSSKPSHVLTSAGLPLEEVRQTIRITLNPNNSKSDLDIFRNIK
ncbi:cysteine desulfurase family protein [Paenibacillus silvae]|uniref:cysteine desulfurase family protein n=1 Tax=Paenibacillus TaxID=44249 RepID=UPI001C10E808|nr:MULTISPECIES: aminotransferase class V-fold PLP-dependent enzyme [Paenibacillus]MBU5353173.1 aminotransferase class V-fold PLP-dependent enzyme [Paenibacillus barcinonensis]MDM5280709.1 aminotransferase class V-fold PLP-dependent enzyme [Paenibacillus silvae]